MRSTRQVAYARLRTQRLASTGFAKPEDVVRWLTAVQAQEYPSATWAIGLRLRRADAGAIERAFADGRILRTHVLRPTWHFVTPEDIRWMLALTAPRIRSRMVPYDRALEIDAPTIARSNDAIAAALEGGAQLTRQELKAALVDAGVAPGGVQRLAHLVLHAELDAIVCSGALRGRQFTYALLDERVPARRAPARDEAVAELTRRYFTSHGPAQLRDFVWWSGLTMTDARAGVEMVRRHLADATIDGHTYWFSTRLRALTRPARAAWLLPPYDEYLIGYADRSAALDPALASRTPDVFHGTVVVDGRVVGGWRQKASRGRVAIALDVRAAPGKADARLVAGAAKRLVAFIEAARAPR